MGPLINGYNWGNQPLVTVTTIAYKCYKNSTTLQLQFLNPQKFDVVRQTAAPEPTLSMDNKAGETIRGLLFCEPEEPGDMRGTIFGCWKFPWNHQKYYPGSSKCVNFVSFHTPQKKLPKGRFFTYLEDPGWFMKKNVPGLLFLVLKTWCMKMFLEQFSRAVKAIKGPDHFCRKNSEMWVVS